MEKSRWLLATNIMQAFKVKSRENGLLVKFGNLIYNRAIFLLKPSKGRAAKVRWEVFKCVCIILVLEKTKCLVRQICNKNLHAAAHDNKSFRFYPEFLNSLMKCQSTEMIESASTPWNKPGETTQFSGAVVRIIIVSLTQVGIQQSDVKIKRTAANCVAIASAVIGRFWNSKRQKALALHYRTSTVVSKSTTKYSFREKS